MRRIRRLVDRSSWGSQPLTQERPAAADHRSITTGEADPGRAQLAEVLDALDTAARVLHELDRNQISLRVEHDPVGREIRAHIRDHSTGEERKIAARGLLDLLSGDLSGLSVDARD
jgi:hypothetical protein